MYNKFILGKEDAVTCYSCGKTLDGWSASDDPWRRHYELNPECYHIRESHTSQSFKQSNSVHPCNKTNQTNKRLETIQGKVEETDDAQETRKSADMVVTSKIGMFIIDLY